MDSEEICQENSSSPHPNVRFTVEVVLAPDADLYQYYFRQKKEELNGHDSYHPEGQQLLGTDMKEEQMDNDLCLNGRNNFLNIHRISCPENFHPLQQNSKDKGLPQVQRKSCPTFQPNLQSSATQTSRDCFSFETETNIPIDNRTPTSPKMPTNFDVNWESISRPQSPYETLLNQERDKTSQQQKGQNDDLSGLDGKYNNFMPHVVLDYNKIIPTEETEKAIYEADAINGLTSRGTMPPFGIRSTTQNPTDLHSSFVKSPAILNCYKNGAVCRLCLRPLGPAEAKISSQTDKVDQDNRVMYPGMDGGYETYILQMASLLERLRNEVERLMYCMNKPFEDLKK